MEVMLILTGATAVAMIFNIIATGRADFAKVRREQIESQSPYEHALKNASEKNFQLRAELSTLHALESIETDNERLQNEIGTIVSKGEGEASEDVYDDDIEDILSDLNAILEQEERSRQKDKQLRERGLLEVNLFGRTSVDMEKAREDDSEFERLTNAYEEHTLIEEIANKTVGSLQLHVEWAKQLGKDAEEVRRLLAKVSEELDEDNEQAREEIRRLRKEAA